MHYKIWTGSGYTQEREEYRGVNIYESNVNNDQILLIYLLLAYCLYVGYFADESNSKRIETQDLYLNSFSILVIVDQ